MSLVSAKVAITKAREVAALVSQLRAVSVSPDEIEVAGVSIDVASGTVIKSSEAMYSLRIACRSLELLPEILGVVSAQKTAHLLGIEWMYSDETENNALWLDAAITEANMKARRISTALGADLLGIHRFHEALGDEDQDASFDSGYGVTRARSQARMQQRTPAPVEFGVNINHSKTVTIRVDIDFRVGSYASRPTAAEPK